MKVNIMKSATYLFPGELCIVSDLESGQFEVVYDKDAVLMGPSNAILTGLKRLEAKVKKHWQRIIEPDWIDFV